MLSVLSLVRSSGGRGGLSGSSPVVATLAVFIEGLSAAGVGKTAIVIGLATAPGLKGSAASA